MRTRAAAVVALVVGAVLPITTVHAEPAVAPSKPQSYVGCSWQVGYKDQTLACGKTFTQQGVAVFSQCWRYRPHPATVQRRVGVDWVRTPLQVRTFAEAASCRPGTPWRSMVTVPVTGKHPGRSATYEIVLPATDQYRRTSLVFGVCVVTTGTTTPCD